MTPPMIRILSRRIAARTIVPLVVTSLLWAGCASLTRTEVAAIVASSNAAMLGGGLPQKGSTPDTWKETNAKFEALISDNAEHPTVVASLRIRQAMLLLAHGKISLARASFEEARAADLHTDRDRTLKRISPHLLWWFAISTEHTWEETDQEKARAALKALATEQTDARSASDIQLYVAELRAWIGFASAKQTTSREERRSRLEDAVNTFAALLTAQDIAALKTRGGDPAERTLTPDARRRALAATVLEAVREFNTQRQVGAQATNPDLNSLISSPTPIPEP